MLGRLAPRRARLPLATVALASGLVLPAPALASAYCVYVTDEAECGTDADDNFATVQEALDAATDHAGADTVRLVAGTHTGPGEYLPIADPVTIQGEPGGGSTLTMAASEPQYTRVLFANLAFVRDLVIALPADPAPADQDHRGLHIRDGNAERVVVTIPAGAANGVGVVLQGGADVAESSVVAQGGASDPDIVGMQVLSDSGSEVRDSTIIAENAFMTEGSAVLRRVKLVATRGIFVSFGQSVAEDVLIDLGARANGSGIHVNNTNNVTGTFGLDARHLTVAYSGPTGSSAPFGARVRAQSSGQDAVLTLRDSILTGPFEVALWRSVSAGTATLTADRVHRDAGVPNEDSSGGGSLTDASPSVGDARLIGSGDFRLRGDSPLIDAGTQTPFDPAVESATDLAGAPRLVDGDATPGAVRDLGAYEFQPQSPTAVATGPATLVAGQPGTFEGSASSDPNPGDALAYAWSFDGGAPVAGATVQNAFATAGAHTALLTVTDASGRQATAALTVDVAPAPDPTGVAPTTGGAVTPALDLTPPVLSGVRLRPRTLSIRGARRMATLSYTSSEAGVARVVVEHLVPGRRVGSRCHRATRRRRRGRRCVRVEQIARLTRPARAGANALLIGPRVGRRLLRPGRHRLGLLVADAAGNVSALALAGFTVRR